MVTINERKNRLLKANDLMKRLDLRSCLIVGNGSVATKEYGFYRYFVDNRVYYHRQALVMVREQEPTVCCGSLTHLKVLNERGFWDVRMVGDRLAEGIVDILKDRGIVNGRIGYCPETLPASWYDIIHSAYPELEWVDCTDEMYALRTMRSNEEKNIAEKGAALALAGYEDLCNTTKMGVTENKLSAELDYAMKKRGAEETFTILNCGQLSNPAGMGKPHSAANSGKKAMNGDCIAAVIAPRCDGYWMQMMRTVCVGKEDPTAVIMHKAVTNWMANAAKMLKPGTKVCDIAACLAADASADEFATGETYGYICGVDLHEQPITTENDTELTENMTLIINPIILKNGTDCGFCWGDTYLVTSTGGRCLTADNRGLRTMKDREEMPDAQ